MTKVGKLRSKHKDFSIFSNCNFTFLQNIFIAFKFSSYIFNSLFKNIKFDIIFNISQINLFKFYNYLY